MKQFLRTIVLVTISFSAISGAAHADATDFRFAMHATPKKVPEIAFEDADGNLLSLKDFTGKYVLLNVWATWCPPCRKELPDLQGLQQALGGDKFQVVALSTDSGKLLNVKALYQELNLDESGIYIDETGAAMRTLGVFAMPTTLLLDPQGREVGRKPGPADWDSAAALAFFEEQLKPVP